jgi:type II secretory ATPase GspE/PulE/Tfp pilus assembly ATPase PilB-like protein
MSAANDQINPPNSTEEPKATDAESVRVVDFVILKKDQGESEETFEGSEGDSQSVAEESNETGETEDNSIAVRSTLQKKYTPDELRDFAQHLARAASMRYEAIILNSWMTGFNTRQFEVGLVHLKNGDHRNGVLRTLKVSPLDVKFVPIESEVFKYLHESIYDPKAEAEAISHEQKKQSQKTKAWGEGQSTLSPEEAFAIQAAEVEYDIGSEEWMDLTNIEEYERNIKRNEAELTTQEFIRLILMEFLRSGSSDMHIESGQPTGRIRLRYDSEMFTRWDDIPFVKIKQIAAGLAETAGKDATRMKFKDIDSTIKVKALRDGVPADVELRFASQPTLYSPSIVLRSQLKPLRDLNVVGFLPRQVEDLELAYSQKRGIIVVTGATGSGKTNTLESIYARLEETDKFKIIEIGEPIEIRSGRRTQISLRPNTPFTWWDAFYSCLRSDPDIIGIGELRSAEHLSVAINAALTGHLVLSTFHAASVEDTLTRMFQMGIPRENLATGINLILAQTLIKRLCEKCKVVDETASEQYGKTVYKSAGCPECFNKGTRGRTAMAELLYFNDEVKQWIQDKNMSARDVVQRASREGHLLPMKFVAREKVIEGIASAQETAGALGYLETSEAWNNQPTFQYPDGAESPQTQEISQGDVLDDDFIEGEIIEE